MGSVTDWTDLWRELSQMPRHRRHAGADGGDPWQERARVYQARAGRRWCRPDSSRETVAAHVAAVPDATLLDVGAGTGAWAAYLAPRAARITAVEPSPSMIAVMRENLAAQGITNVDIVQAAWPADGVAAHDFSLCAHAMYGATDLPGFVRRIEQVTRRTCFLVLRAPSADGVMAEAARRVWGHPHDGPSFQIAYNVLLQMGIRANVLFEEAGLWDPRSSTSLEEALGEVKRRLALGTGEHDAYLLELLRRRLHEEDGRLIWPCDMRSALVYWRPGVD
jgi:SAM-dependent methyltransferase